MIQNYLKTAFRSLWKNKGFTAINIAGLAIGLATCLLILIYVMDELSYDKWNVNAGRIFRLDNEISFSGNHFDLAAAPGPAGPALKRDYPEVEKAVRINTPGSLLIRKGNQNIREDKVALADSTFFEVFSVPLLAGDPHTALVAPHTIVLSEKMAQKYFDKQEAVGKTLLIGDSILYNVTGVMKDIPEASHFHFDLIASLAESDDAKRTDQWLSQNYNVYVLLRKGADWKPFEQKMSDGFLQHYIAPLVMSALHLSMDDYFKAGNKYSFSLTPLMDIHLHSNKASEIEPNGNIQYVYIFSAIAVFILLIACVNFMNLSTARSANRAKEVGIRKVLGSMRSGLVTQFLLESVLISFIGMLLAVGLAWLLLPLFNNLAAKQMSLDLIGRPLLLPSLIGLMLVVGLLAGSYPALFLSGFQPIEVLKGKLSRGFKGGWLRNGLVVVQFAISIVLIFGTVVIYRQLAYIQNRQVGFNRDEVLCVQNTGVLGEGIKAYKDELSRLPGVSGITVTGFTPTGGWQSNNTFFLTPDFDIKKGVNMEVWPVDENYIPVMQMQLEAGRNFSREFGTDSAGVIVNEAMVRQVGLLHPIGAKIYTLDDIMTKRMLTYQIIGVVKDFNYNSLRQVVTPLAFFLKADYGRISMRVNTQNIPKLVSEVEAGWHRFAPSQPFDYTFMDDQFNKIYRSERRMGGISLSFSLLAILIACMGLFGLAAYAAEQRTREIGIRKVLGASVKGIIGLLSRDFLLLVLLSAVIAVPLAWWGMHHWLEDFAYRIDIGWEIALVAVAAAAGIAMLTVSVQALKAALVNPVRSLRTE
jgi:putative ABC transport system permease protein